MRLVSRLSLRTVRLMLVLRERCSQIAVLVFPACERLHTAGGSALTTRDSLGPEKGEAAGIRHLRCVALKAEPHPRKYARPDEPRETHLRRGLRVPKAAYSYLLTHPSRHECQGEIPMLWSASLRYAAVRDKLAPWCI